MRLTSHPLPTTHKRLVSRLVCLCTCVLLGLVVTADIDKQKLLSTMQLRYGNDGVAMLNEWQSMLSRVQSQSTLEQVAQVNSFFNRHIRYTEDSLLWHKSDYWATPLETLGVRAGDCEDYTIAKYVSLVELGVPIQQLRLIYVKAQLGGSHSSIFQAHMVLGYYTSADATPLILDSLINTIEPANKRTDLRPVFSFNSAGLWIGNQYTAADPTARLSRWRDLLARLQAEGFSLSAPPQQNNLNTANSSSSLLNQSSTTGN